MQRGEIYLAQLQNTNGSIQQGLRPVIIVQNNIGNMHSPTIIVCSITTAPKRKLPTHVYIPRSGGLKERSIMLGEQMHTLNKKDLIKQLGTITDQETLRQINKALLISLGVIWHTISSTSKKPRL